MIKKIFYCVVPLVKLADFVIRSEGPIRDLEARLRAHQISPEDFNTEREFYYHRLFKLAKMDLVRAGIFVAVGYGVRELIKMAG